MNLSLIDPADLVHDYPETITRTLKNGVCTTIRFNHSGDFFACGRADGTIIIYDIETNAVARKLKGHSRQVQSLSWSHNGRYLLSASLDWKAIIWDLKGGSRLRLARFNGPPYYAEIHPRNHLKFVVAILLDEPLLVDCTEDRPIIQSLPTQLASATEESGKSKKPDTTTFAIWVNDGTRIITGTEKGYLNVINPSNRQIESRHQAAGGTITSIKFHEPSNTILINSGDKVIRKLSVTKLLDPKNPSASPAIRYEDMINHLSWNNMCYSHTGDYVVASIYMQWKAYIWEHHTGSLVKIIEGPSEELGAIESHPSRPLICAAGIESGAIYVWSIIQPQRWAALAPDFVEVEENEEYEEREDEFDVQDEEMVRRRRLEREDEEVDVLTISEDVLRAMGNRLPRRLQNHAGSGMESTGAKDEEPFVLPLLLEVDDSGAEEARIGAKQKPIGDDGRGRGQGSGSGRSSQSNSRPPTPGEEQAEVQSCTSSQTVSRDVSQHRHVNGVNNGTGKSSVKGSVRSGSKPGTSKGKKRKKRPDLPL